MLSICSIVFLGGFTANSPTVKDVDLDALMTKWRNSDNWVLIAHTTTDGMYDKGNYSILNETEVVKRNGNTIMQTQSLIQSQDNYTTENQTMSIVEYDDKGGATVYYYRKQLGEKKWDMSFVSPNPNKTTAEERGARGGLDDFFNDSVMSKIWRNIEHNSRTIREVSGVYHFWGIEDMNETWRWLDSSLGSYGQLLGNEYTKSFFNPVYDPPIYMTFSYTLIFGCARIDKPTNICECERRNFSGGVGCVRKDEHDCSLRKLLGS